MLLRSRLVALYVPRVPLLLFSGSCGFLAYSLVYGVCCCCYVASVVSNSVRPHRRQATRLPGPWDSPSKNTGVGCHFLLQCMKVKTESETVQSCPTLGDPMDCSLPGASILATSKILNYLHFTCYIGKAYFLHLLPRPPHTGFLIRTYFKILQGYSHSNFEKTNKQKGQDAHYLINKVTITESR